MIKNIFVKSLEIKKPFGLSRPILFVHAKEGTFCTEYFEGKYFPEVAQPQNVKLSKIINCLGHQCIILEDIEQEGTIMTYTAQDLFDYADENGNTLDVHEIMEAMAKFPNDIMDAFDYAIMKDFAEELEMSEEDIITTIQMNHAGSLSQASCFSFKEPTMKLSKIFTHKPKVIWTRRKGKK